MSKQPFMNRNTIFNKFRIKSLLEVRWMKNKVVNRILDTFVCLLWTLLYLWGVPLLMKHFDVTISSPLKVISLIICFLLLLRYGSKGTAINPIEPEKRPPLLKKAIFMFLLFAITILFFANSYFSTYLLLGIILEIATLLPITNYIMNLGGIFYEKNNH